VVFPTDLKPRHKLDAMQQMNNSAVAPLIVASAFVLMDSPGVTIVEVCCKGCVRETVGSGDLLANTDAWMHKTRGSRIAACSWAGKLADALRSEQPCYPVSGDLRTSSFATPTLGLLYHSILLAYWCYTLDSFVRITMHNRFVFGGLVCNAKIGCPQSSDRNILRRVADLAL
jgi:hypothetical protein